MCNRAGRSEFADLLESVVKWVRKHLPKDNVTAGVLLVAFSLFGIRFSMALFFFAVGLGLLLMTWHKRIHVLWRAIFCCWTLLGVWYWFDKASIYLSKAHATTGFAGVAISSLEQFFRFGFMAVVVVTLLILVKHRPAGQGHLGPGPRSTSDIPAETFRDVGGLREEKRRIENIVNNRLHPQQFARHGVVRNGILLHGPRGTGKTFIARATAGEFKINFQLISPTSLKNLWIGNTEANLRNAFQSAWQNRPILLFIDEIDAIGTQRQLISSETGSATKFYNSVVIELMQCMDRYRNEEGFIIMGATNFYDALDEALIREMRFDEKIRIDLPDENTRQEILSAQLSRRPWRAFPLDTFARPVGAQPS
jgi:ATP-dependent Zn protease